MVRRVLKMVYSEVRGLHQAAYVLALFAFGSQMLALVRDRLLAGTFGTGPELDLYYAAFKIPDVLFVVFSSVLSVYVLMPFVTRAQAKEGDKVAQDRLSQLFSLFLCLYAVVALVLWVVVPLLVPKLFPGLVASSDELVLLVRILLLQPLLLGVSSLLGVVTQLHHRFVLYAISPLIYNLGIIAGITLLYPLLGLSGLVWGVVLGAAGHMLVQLPLVRQSSLAFTFVRQIDWRFIKEVCFVAVPRSITLSLHQIVLLCMVSFASAMAVGSVSVFQFAFNLQSVPLAIVGVSYSVAAFPTLADLLAKQKLESFCLHILTALKHIIFWSLPIMALMIVLRAHIVRVLLGTGAFDWEATRLTAAVLALFALSLVAQAINLLIVRAFYAAGNTRIPLVITVLTSIIAIISAYLLYVYATINEGVLSWFASLMRVSEVPGIEVLALPIGFTLGMILQTTALLLAARIRFNLSLNVLVPQFARATWAAVVGGVTAYATLNFVVSGINPDTFIGISIQGLLGGIAGVIGVIAAYYVVRSPELYEVLGALETKIFKTDVVAPQEEVL